MNALRLSLIASLLAFATAHAAGDEMPVETIVVTAKRPTFVEPAVPILIVTVTARAPAWALVAPDVRDAAAAESVALEPPKTKPVIETPRLPEPELSIAPPRLELALAETTEPQG